MTQKPVVKFRTTDRLGRLRTIYSCMHGHWHGCDRQARECNARHRREAIKRSQNP